MFRGLSEYGQFMNTLRHLGIEHSENHGPTKEEWQQEIIAQGFNLTALACTVVTVGDCDYLFSNGQAHWTDDDKGHGPSSVLLFSRNKTTGAIAPRVHYDRDSGIKQAATGLDALRSQYHF